MELSQYRRKSLKSIINKGITDSISTVSPVVETVQIVKGIYLAQKTKFSSHTLQPEKGIFQSDVGSNLWHDVTPIAIVDPKSGNGREKHFGVCYSS